jgi:hypothetical protein
MAGNSININSDVNTVNIQPDNNKITVVNPDNTSVNITQPVTNVIQVATPGPAGPAGPTGPTGPSGSFETGSFVTTSSFNSFTSSIQTEVDNLTSQTGSYVLNSQTGSFATTGSNNFIGNQVITGSVDVKNGNINIESNSYFLQGTSTGGNNVSLIGVNNQDEIYIGNQGYDNIIAGATNIEGNTQITGSLTASGNISSSGIVYGTTGSFSYLQGNSPITVGDSVTFQQPITASGNISSSGNIITTEVTASKITSGDSTLILGYAGSNNITIEDGGDFFIDASLGTLEIYGQSANIYVSNDITLDGNVIATSNITASGNISSSGNIIANQIDTTQITGNPSQVTLGYAGSYNNQIILENGGDLFINALGGYIQIECGDGAKIEVSDGIYMYDVNSTYAFGVETNTLYFGVPVNQLISNTFLSSSNVITTNITASALTSNDGQLFLGFSDDENITIQEGADVFINAQNGYIEMYGDGAEVTVGGNVITLNASVNATSDITASGNISSSGTITATSASFTHISGTISNIIWTVDFTDGELNTRLYAPYNLSIDSIDNVYNSPTTAISSSGSPYTLGNAITTGDPIDITVNIGSVINLNITR